jgi:NADPH2 dehydrogenase
MSRLFDPIELRGVALANRIAVSPMCQYSAVDGNAGDWHRAHLTALAVSGAGLVIQEATAVAPEGRITPRCLGLWNDANEAALAAALAMARAAAPWSRLAIQLAHAGRKGSSEPPWRGGQLIDPAQPVDSADPTDPAYGGWVNVAPSAIPHAAGEPRPRALSLAEIEALPRVFAAAARRAARLGYDAIELHMAHGYLLHQFLSPVANRRTDQYGGGFENRARLPLAVFDAVRAAVPDGLPLGVRLSATDWLDGEDAWTLEQTIALVQLLAARGCDWVDVSSGGISPHQKIALGPGYQVPFARAVKRATGVATMTVGLITTAEQAEAIVTGGDADLVALGRAFLFDPRWPWRAALALGGAVNAPPPYWRALPPGSAEIFGPAVSGQR